MRPRRPVCGPRQSPECATTKTAQSSHRPTAYGLSCRVIGRDVETAHGGEQEFQISLEVSEIEARLSYSDMLEILQQKL